MASCELQCSETTRIGFLMHGIVANKFLSHSASYPANSIAMNSDYIVEQAMHVYFEDFHTTVPSPIVKIKPLVELTSSLSVT